MSAAKTATTPKQGPFDPWLVGAIIGAVAAVSLAAWLIFEADPASAPGLILIGTLTLVAGIGVFGFGRGDYWMAKERTEGDVAVDLLDAIAEPAALVWKGGKVLAFNGPWIEAGGATVSLPPSRSASALFMAFAQAEKGHPGRATLTLGGRDVEVLIGAAGAGRYLIREAVEEATPQVGLQPNAPSVVSVARAGEGRAMAAGAPFGSAVIGGDDLFAGKAEEANLALEALTGPAASRDAAFGHLFDPKGVDEARAALAEGSSGPIALIARAFPDRTLHMYVAPEGDRRRVWLFDVTGQKSTELQLAQAQKMQAIGLLAGGVAHDFNNLLTAIEMQLDALLQRHPVGDPSYEGLNEIRKTGHRSADLVRKLLAFSSKQTVRRERLELGELISEFEVLLRRLMREDVRLETDYGPDLPAVVADKSQVETAVMNLAVNARDAMRGMVEPGQGVVRIQTRRLDRTQADILGWPAAPREGAALIEVSDTGPGIPPELLDKIFEPFFTTKAVGEGTGMGLATVYGIVQQAGGHITVGNLEGAGAVFRIFLPIASEEALSQVAPVEERRAVPRDLSGAGRILFVEDEAAVRGIAARLLRERGYEVIEASDGEEALILAEENAGTLDMLISDVIMPGLDGPSLLKKAQPFLGDIPVMFISGYAESDFSDLLEDQKNVSFLPKPLNIKTLAERVKMALRPE